MTSRGRLRPVTKSAVQVLRLEALEARDVPAVTIQLDYSFDTSGYFTNRADARAILDRVASELGSGLTADLSPITPGGGNTWTPTAFNPSGSGQISIPNLSLPADTIRVYVGARNMGGGSQGVGGPGGYSASGSADWFSTLQTRGHSGYAPWGGSLSFSSATNWWFGQTTAGITSAQSDFYSVALHEMGHVLGIGTAPQWSAQVRNGTFTGANAVAAYGAPVPVTPDGAHWADGLVYNGQPASMDPVLTRGTRVDWSALDSAALRDLGWNSGPLAAPTPAPPTAPPPQRVPLGSVKGVVITGGTDGTVSVFTGANGAVTDTGLRLTPFAGYRGAIRVAGGDFNGDGVGDYAFTTGAGPQSVVQILDGRDGSLLVNQRAVFPGFRGGLFLAAADIDRDGRAELAISADAGAGPHIQTFRVVNGDLELQSSFFAFDNPAFRGGARVAAGDLDRDGFADLVVTTGGQAEGRVAVYSGAALRVGSAQRLAPDFIAFAGMWGAVNAAVGDMDGDGFAELAVTPERGGPAHVKVWSGRTLAAAPGVQASALPLTASFYALNPADPSGARLALRDTTGDGRAELFVVSANPGNALARTFTFEQAVAGGAGAPQTYPLNSTVSFDGLYAGLSAADAPADEPLETVVVPPPTRKCMCGGCTALAALAGDPVADLVPAVAVR